MVYFLIIFISIILHELGHYVAAISCSISVRKFCIFWDPGFHLYSTGNRYKTELCIGWLPLGGYVALKTPEDDNNSCNSILEKPVWQRLVFYFSGLLVNLIIAFSSMYAFTDHYGDPDNHYSVAVKANYSRHCLEKKTIRYYKSLANYFCSDNHKEKQQVNKDRQYHYRTLPLYIINNKEENDDLSYLLWEISNINLILFLFNLIPMPPLDGGNLILNLYNLLTGKKVNENLHLVLACVGAIILLGMMAYDFFLDLSHVFTTT